MSNKSVNETMRPGDPILARHFNELRREVLRNRVNVSGASNQVQTAGGLLVRVSPGAGEAVLFATNTETTFAADSTRALDLYNGRGEVLFEDVTVRNPSWAGSYPAEARLILSWDGSEWIVIGRWCPEP
jgi:hypothetical protein